MLYHFLYSLAGEFHGLNLFRYITFRAGGALLTALFLGFWMGPFLFKLASEKTKRRLTHSRRWPPIPPDFQKEPQPWGDIVDVVQHHGVNVIMGPFGFGICMDCIMGDLKFWFFGGR